MIVVRVERPLLAFGATAFLYLVTFRRGTFLYLFHKATTGVWVDEGARVAGGERMYRDFSDVVGPGIVHLYAGLIRLFGPRLDVLAWAGIVVGVAVALLLHAVTTRAASRTAGLFAAVLFVVLVYAPGRTFGGPEWPALALILLGLLPVMGRPVSLARACLAGLALGLACLFQIEMGVGAALGVAAHLVREERGKGRACVVFGLAGLALPALVSVAFSMVGADTVLSSWLAASWRHRIAELRIDVGQAFGIRLAAWAALVLGGAASAVALLRRGRPRAEAGTRLVARAGLGVLLAPAVAHVDAYTLAVQSTILIGCLASALEGLARSRSASRWVARAALAVLGIGLVQGAVGLVVWRQLVQVPVRQRFRAGAAWIGAPALDLEWIERNTAPGDRIFVFPAGGMYYFLTRTRNATSFPAMVEGRFGVDEQRRALAEIDAARPSVGVWIAAERFPAPRGFPGLDTLYEGIRARYEPEGVLPNGTILLRRRHGPAP